jgi:hypothetical protein
MNDPRQNEGSSHTRTVQQLTTETNGADKHVQRSAGTSPNTDCLVWFDRLTMDGKLYSSAAAHQPTEIETAKICL